MSATLEEFRSKFRLAELEIHRTQYWTWSVRPVPCTLGAGILSLNRFSESFADLGADEAADLAGIVKHLDRKLQQTFAPQRMNYLMLMMVDRHLHFHVLPRYSEDKSFAGLIWHDSGWPKPPALGDYEDRSASPALLEVRDALR